MYAAVDVGTNTVRLLLGEIRQGRIFLVHHFRQITRLGGGATLSAGLSQQAMERTLAALHEVAVLIHQAGARQVRAVGTAALRDAANGDFFVQRVRAETGLILEIVDGEEEARLCARGVMAALDTAPRRGLIFDIGGGSTEFILREVETTTFHRSYPLGVVGLCERFPENDRQLQRIDEVLDCFARDLASADVASAVMSDECRLIGTAGTVTTLAALKLGMTEYDWRRVNNLVLTLAELRPLLHRLEHLDVVEREALPGMEKGRGDLIVPGLRIVLALMARFGKQHLTVSDFGLLEGVLLGLAEGSPCA